MKKLALTIAIVLGLGMMAVAGPNEQSGLFKRGTNAETSGLYSNRDTGPLLPVLPTHGYDDDQNAPLGSGIALLLGLGGAYLVAKRREE